MAKEQNTININCIIFIETIKANVIADLIMQTFPPPSTILQITVHKQVRILLVCGPFQITDYQNWDSLDATPFVYAIVCSNTILIYGWVIVFSEFSVF